MSDCKVLQLIKSEIEKGTPPEQAIPYSIECTDMDSFIEVLYYAVQILPPGRRLDEARAKLEEVLNVRRTESEL